MKSLLPLASLLLALLLLLCACSGNYAPVALNRPIPLPEDGIIQKEMLEQIKEENAIATFTGHSGGMDYEWKIFASALTETHDVNLSLTLEKTDGGIRVQFPEGEAFGFSAYLSIYLNEKWTALHASMLREGVAVASVSLTGNKATILNLSVSEPMGDCVIVPDRETDTAGETTEGSETEETLPAETTATNTEAAETSAPEEETTLSETDGTETLETETAIVTETRPETETEPDSKAETETETEGVEETSTQAETRPISDGKETGQDKYLTDPVPEGKPLPVEPENQEVNKGTAYTCTFSIECSTILNNLENLDPDKLELVPSDGVILPPTTVTFYEGESVFDVIQRVCKEYNIHLEFSWTPIYNSAYIEGIHNLYEFDCGPLSGWMYRVNGWYPNYGCSRYQLADGEVVEWRYTCNDLGKDIGCDWMG